MSTMRQIRLDEEVDSPQSQNNMSDVIQTNKSAMIFWSVTRYAILIGFTAYITILAITHNPGFFSWHPPLMTIGVSIF